MGHEGFGFCQFCALLAGIFTIESDEDVCEGEFSIQVRCLAPFVECFIGLEIHEIGESLLEKLASLSRGCGNRQNFGGGPQRSMESRLPDGRLGVSRDCQARDDQYPETVSHRYFRGRIAVTVCESSTRERSRLDVPGYRLGTLVQRL